MSLGGFYGRAGLSFGLVSVTHGLGGFGVEVIDLTPPPIVDILIPGTRGPREFARTANAPKMTVYRVGAKEECIARPSRTRAYARRSPRVVIYRAGSKKKGGA